MSESDVGALLREAAGSEHVHALDPPLHLGGARLEWHVEPTDVEALSRVLAALDASGERALVVGGGTRIDAGAPCEAATVLLSTRGLTGVLTFEVEEGVIEVAAGTPLLDVLDHLNGTLWELPLDAPGEDTTVGGVLATAMEGPRRVAFGRVRRQVLGLEVVLADGTRARCGGRVVKNVTGYDLAKLHVGAQGTLGVIASAWLRLRPRPEKSQTFAARFDELAPACRAVRLAQRLPSARMVTLLSGDLATRVSGLVERGAAWVAAVELAGSDELCARDGATLEREASARARDFSVDGVGHVSLPQSGERVRARVAVLPSHFEAAIAAFREAGLSIAAHPDPGLVEVALDPSRGESVDEAIALLDAAHGRHGGPVVFDRRGDPWRPLPAGPAQASATAEAAGARAIWRALEEHFDPRGILNPGRIDGGALR